MIAIDTGGRTFLAVCTDCPSWRALAMDRAAALNAGATHAADCHHDHTAAADLRRRADRIT